MTFEIAADGQLATIFKRESMKLIIRVLIADVVVSTALLVPVIMHSYQEICQVIEQDKAETVDAQKYIADLCSQFKNHNSVVVLTHTTTSTSKNICG